MSAPGRQRGLNGRGIGSLKMLPAIILAIGPLLSILASALPAAIVSFTITGPTAVRLFGLFLRSIGLSILVTFFALLLGSAYALWLARQHGLAGRLGWFLLPLPLLLPGYVLGLTWWSLFDRSGLLGGLVSAAISSREVLNFCATSLVLSFAWFPVVAVVLLLDLESIPVHVVECAETQGDASRTWTRGILPGLFAPLFSSGAFIFCAAMTAYSVPALFQIPAYSTELYSEFSFSGDSSVVALLALPLLLLGAVCAPFFAAGLTISPGGRVLPGGRACDTPSPPKWFRFSTAVMVLPALIVPVATPLLLTWKVGSAGTFMESVVNARPELLYSTTISLLAALVAVLCALPVATRLLKRPSKGLLAFCLLPAMVPAPLYALGVSSSGLFGKGVPAFVCAHAGRFLPFALLTLVLVLRRLNPRLLEAADILPHRLSWWRFRIKLHLLLPALFVAGAVVFSLSLGDIGVSVLVAPPGAKILSVKLFNLLHYGAGDQAAALALSLVPLVYLVWGAAAVFARMTRDD